MIDVNAVTLENGQDYLIMETIIFNNVEYLYLVNESDIKDVCIRKKINENEETYLTGLDNEDELEKVLKEFAKCFKNKKS